MAAITWPARAAGLAGRADRGSPWLAVAVRSAASVGCRSRATFHRAGRRTGRNSQLTSESIHRAEPDSRPLSGAGDRCITKSRPIGGGGGARTMGLRAGPEPCLGKTRRRPRDAEPRRQQNRSLGLEWRRRALFNVVLCRWPRDWCCALSSFILHISRSVTCPSFRPTTISGRPCLPLDSGGLARQFVIK